VNSWYKVQLFNLDENLSPLLSLLHKGRIPHRVTEEGGFQCLWLLDASHAVLVENLYTRINSDDKDLLAAIDSIESECETGKSSFTIANSLFVLLRGIRAFPVTSLTLLLGLCGFLLVEYDTAYQWISLFTLQPMRLIDDQLYLATITLTLEQREYWRFISPIFLHFGILHFIFNSLWIFEFGRKIEAWKGPLTLLVIILIAGIASNLGQYWWGGPSLMGGLSGVIYGLLGFIGIHQKLNPQSSLNVPPSIIIFMLVWLVIGMSGAVNLFIDGSVANMAHAGGLIVGIILALVFQILPIKFPNKSYQ
jgi:GlpG protein